MLFTIERTTRAGKELAWPKESLIPIKCLDLRLAVGAFVRLVSSTDSNECASVASIDEPRNTAAEPIHRKPDERSIPTNDENREFATRQEHKHQLRKIKC